MSNVITDIFRPGDLLGVTERFFAADSLCRVKAQQLAQQVQSQRIRLGIHLMPWLPWLDGQGTNVP